jgi:hypothetical protein
MIQDEETLPQMDQNDRELLLYDYLKYLTSLVLLTLGGALIVIKDFDPADVNPTMVVIALALISVAGVLAFAGSAEIVRSRYTGVPATRSVKLARAGAPALLAFGIGLFLAMFIDSLVK